MEEKNKDKISRMKVVMRPIKVMWYALLILLFLFVVSYFLLKVPAVQNYIADRTTSILSNRLNTKVEVERIDINMFKGVELEKFYLEDLNGDTLIYAGSLYSDFYNSLKGFYQKDFNMDVLNLENGTINLKRTNRDPLNNLQRLLNQDYDPYSTVTIQKDTTDATIDISRPTEINLRGINLKNIRFTNVDSLGGNIQVGLVESLTGTLDTFDLNSLNFSFTELSIDKVNFEMERFEADTLLRRLPDKEDDSKEFEYHVNIAELELENSSFSYKDLRYELEYPSQSFNPYDFNLEELKIKAQQIALRDPYYFTSKLENLSVKMDGLSIETLTAENFFFDKRKAGLENFLLKTEKSTLKDNFSLKYRKLEHWRDFVNKVLLDGDLEKSTIALEDIVFFAPKLRNNTFFTENVNKKLKITGKVMGAVNRLNVRNLNADLGNNLTLRGSFIARDLTDPDETLLNITLDRMITDVTTLKKLIPGFNLPENFYLLNTIDFNGRFDGYYQDFVAYGDIITDLGQGDVDMRLNLKNGAKNASYSGRLNLFNFDLATWTGVEDFDKLSLSANVTNGRGLELNTAYAELGGEIISFDYKGYNYDGIIDAKLEQNLFDGSLKMTDENISFDFLGNINFQEEIPLYDFEADIKKINLMKLNLSDSISHVSGLVDIKLKGTNIDNIIGSALGNKLLMVKSGDTLDFGHLAVASTTASDVRTIFVDSDAGNAEIVGKYKLTELPDAAIGLLKNNYPLFTENLKFINKEPDGQVKADFNIELKDVSELISFFAGREADIKDLRTEGTINYEQNDLKLVLTVPHVAFDEMKYDSVSANFEIDNGIGAFSIYADSSLIKALALSEVDIHGSIESDTIYFEIDGGQVLDSISNIELAGKLSPVNDQVFLSMKKMNFDVLQESWSLSKNNEILVGDGYLSLRNFILTDENRRIEVKSINDNKGIQTNIKDLQLSLVNRWINKDNFVLNGDVTAQVSFEDIFNLEGLFVKSEIKDFRVNEQQLGVMNINVITDLKTQRIAYDLFLDNYHDEVTLDGTYDLETKGIYATLKADGFPLSFLENFLSTSISNTKGRVFGRMDILGQLDALKTTGKGEIRDGLTTINYIGTTYSFEEAFFKIKDNFIDFTGAKLIDSREQVAIIDGGITHNSFRDLGCKVNISSDKFILLNTDVSQNPTYYGFGQGRANVDIVGPFRKIKMNIDATTGEETKMTMPVSYSNTTRDQSFIPIISKKDFLAQRKSLDANIGVASYTGLDLNLILEVTPDAEMTILFDPASGHKLTGIGEGEINLQLFPSGEMKMFGDYNVDEGQYDFALRNFIKKEFKIRRDGKVSWQGDPLDATIDIQADYKSLRVPLNIFLAEFLGEDENLKAIASQDEDVQVSVNLSERLLNPTINFDIEFPNLTGQLRSMTENKLATLKSDPTGLNNQVFGLFIFNSFIPYDNPIANANIGSSVSVIASELFSAQLSAYVSSIFESILNEDGFIYDLGVDVRVGNANLLNANSTNYGLTLNPKLNSDRFEVTLGGDYLQGGIGNNNTYVSGDFIVDYFLVENSKKLKVRLYGSSDENVNDGRFHKVGSGLFFRREFSSFEDLRKSFQDAVGEIDKKDLKVKE